jgi:gamma-glutamyltranspeptidase/glutathione hydrolase
VVQTAADAHLLACSQCPEGYPLKDWGFRPAQAVHADRGDAHAYVDRNSWPATSTSSPTHRARLLDGGYAAIRAATIRPRPASQKLWRDVAPHEGSNTTHHSIVDGQGNAVAVTYTLNDWLAPYHGRRPASCSTTDRRLQRQDRRRQSLAWSRARRTRPRRRARSADEPDDRRWDGRRCCLGAPGGGRIITAVVHTIVNVIDYAMSVQEAVDAPRFHQQWLPAATNLEAFALSPDTRRILEGMGHVLGAAQPAGQVAAILVGAPALGAPPVGSNRFYGAIDPRRNSGLALGD